MFSDTPLHDWASDWSDAFRYMALAVGILSPATVNSTLPKVDASGIVHMKEFHLEGLHEDAAYYASFKRIA